MSIRVNDIDQRELEEKILEIVANPGSMPNPNVIVGLPDLLKEGQDRGVPTAAELGWAGGAIAPAGYLLEDGSVQDRATYQDLFDVIGTTYNTGGETGTQFRLPNNPGFMIKT